MHRLLGGVALLILAVGFGSGFATFGTRSAEARRACEADGGRLVFPFVTLRALFAGDVPPPVCKPTEADD